MLCQGRQGIVRAGHPDEIGHVFDAVNHICNTPVAPFDRAVHYAPEAFFELSAGGVFYRYGIALHAHRIRQAGFHDAPKRASQDRKAVFAGWVVRVPREGFKQRAAFQFVTLALGYFQIVVAGGNNGQVLGVDHQKLARQGFEEGLQLCCSGNIARHHQPDILAVVVNGL